MKILALIFVFYFATPVLAASTPEQTVTDFVEQMLVSDCFGSKNAACYQPALKFVDDAPFIAKKTKKKIYGIDFYRFQDYSVGSWNRGTGLIDVTVYDHKFQHKTVITFKLIGRGTGYRVVPQQIPRKEQGEMSYVTPWQSTARVEYTYDPQEDKTLHPPATSLPEPLGLHFGETSIDQARAIIKNEGGEEIKAGFRYVKGGTNLLNTDIQGIFFKKVDNIEIVKLFFFNDKLCTLNYVLEGPVADHRDVFRAKYGKEDEKGYDVIKDYMTWSWKNFEINLNTEGSKTNVLYELQDCVRAMENSDEQLVENEQRTRKVKPSAI